ncbi:inositol monophosphatase family protein [Shumkonia mesophila]|uniref:inositol monophosphatase family protein n=1 Tax=Shumkonia mesophila TaxID=2838854 RepID=UPI002934D143|nr:inositol monophosphatase [Shumkonia mesophila]
MNRSVSAYSPGSSGNRPASRHPDFAAVTAILRETAAIEVMPRFRRLAAGDVREKGPGDLVTVADVASERRLTAALMALVPESVVVGEEGVDADPSVLDLLAGPAPVWVVDPVDGTGNFAAGRECFAMIVAYVEGGETVAGWIYDPVHDVTIHGAVGEGAWCDGVRLAVAPAKPLAETIGSAPSRVRKRVAERGAAEGIEVPGHLLQYRCAGREYMDMAQGGLDFARYGRRLKPWDHAAGVLLHREAGGFSAVDEAGRPYSPRDGIVEGSLLVAADAAMWEVLAGLLIPSA